MPTEEAQQIEDLTAALEKAEAQAEKYRAALAELQNASLLWRDTEFGRLVARVAVDALWTRTENREDLEAGW